MIRQPNGVGTASRARETRSSARKNLGRATSVVVGSLVGLDQAGDPQVENPGNHRISVPARSTVTLSENQVGREVALMFVEGKPDRPLVVGVLQDPLSPAPQTKQIQGTIDSEALTITAEKEIVLQCGEPASIILTRDGKIQLRGTYLLSRSSGVNRIQGGSIETN